MVMRIAGFFTSNAGDDQDNFPVSQDY